MRTRKRSIVVEVTEVREAHLKISESLWRALRRARGKAKEAAVRRVLDEYPSQLGTPEWTQTTVTDEEGNELFDIG